MARDCIFYQIVGKMPSLKCDAPETLIEMLADAFCQDEEHLVIGEDHETEEVDAIFRGLKAANRHNPSTRTALKEVEELVGKHGPVKFW